LGRFLFSGDDVLKPISTLSGGQRSRVALARLTLEGANLLLLDEPTNHLDIQSQEVLEDVLRSFPGTVLLVTHDRYLVDAVATQVWMIDAEEETLRAYPGNYSDYLAVVQAEQEALAAAAAVASGQPVLLTESQTHRERGRAERRQRKAAEQRAAEADRLLSLIEGLETRLAAIGDEIAQASSAQDARRVHDLGIEYQAVDARLHQLMEEWAEVVG
jgi:ATP-binding cassette subfamily F protein 3